jgi:hypothetical protein
MTTKQHIDTKALAVEAAASQNKEAYHLLEKTRSYRVGVGARANEPAPSFFVEAVINLSSENGEADLTRLENILTCLKSLKSRGYSLTHDDGNCISCERTAIQDPNEEYHLIIAAVEAANI